MSILFRERGGELQFCLCVLDVPRTDPPIEPGELLAQYVLVDGGCGVSTLDGRPVGHDGDNDTTECYASRSEKPSREMLDAIRAASEWLEPMEQAQAFLDMENNS